MLLDTGQVASQAEIARRRGISRTRVTQIMKLLLLPEEVVNAIEGGDKNGNHCNINERYLRSLLKTTDKSLQIKRFQAMINCGFPPDY